jgi:hypothetical protein
MFGHEAADFKLPILRPTKHGSACFAEICIYLTNVILHMTFVKAVESSSLAVFFVLTEEQIKCLTSFSGSVSI